MPRELPSYRDNLEDILHFSGGKRLLHINEVCEYLGICYKTAKKQFGITKDGISAASLARQLAKLSD